METLNVRMLAHIPLSHLGNSFYHVFTLGLEMSRCPERGRSVPLLVSHSLGAPNM